MDPDTRVRHGLPGAPGDDNGSNDVRTSSKTIGQRSVRFLLAMLCAVSALMASSVAAGAMPVDSVATGPSITSDKEDYAPGERVTLTGSGWQPGETVHINVNDDQGKTWSRDVDVTADADGRIVDSFNLPDWFVATYAVRASAPSGVATSSFTDGNVVYSPLRQPLTGWSSVEAGQTSGFTLSATKAGGGDSPIVTSLAVERDTDGRVTCGAAPTGTAGAIAQSWVSTTSTFPRTIPSTTTATTFPITVAPPAGTTAGYYRGVLKLKTDGPGGTGGAGDGMAVCIQVTPATPSDTTAPTSGASAKNADTTSYSLGDWTNQNVSVTLSGSDNTGGSGLKEIRYTTDGTTPSKTAGSVYSSALTFSAEGVTTLRWVAVDNAGNVESPVRSVQIRIDKTAPSVQCGSADTSWHGSNVSIACTASDGASGLASAGDASFSLTTSVAAGTETQNAATGSRTVSDQAGNSATAGPISGNKVDRKGPSFTCDPASTAWSAADVSRDCTARDGGSGLTPASDGSFSLTTNVASGTETDNAQTGSKQLTDAVGNTTTAGPLGGNRVDKKGPSFSCDPAPTAWSAADVSRDCTARDGGSGLTPASDASFSLTTNVASGTETDSAQTGSKQLTDAVGNSATAGPLGGNKVDKKAPVLADGGPTTQPNAAGWYAADVVNTFTASDGGSGLKSPCAASFTRTTAGEGRAVTVASGPCEDNVGNSTASIDSAAFRIDTTAPDLGITDNNPAASTVCGLPVKPGFSPSDSLSGLETQGETWTPSTTPSGVGTYRYSARATDAAGNAASYARTYTVTYGAAVADTPFLQPINTDGSSRFKLGSTVPVKFQAMCGTSPVAGLVARLYVAKGDSTADPGVDEAISTSSATTGNLFRYDTLAQQYIFNLSTKLGYTNPGSSTAVSFTTGTWTLRIGLDDGTSRAVAVQLPR